jgi:hypothetical protein
MVNETFFSPLPLKTPTSTNHYKDFARRVKRRSTLSMLILLRGTLCPPAPTPSGRSAVAPFPCLHPFRFTPARTPRPSLRFTLPVPVIWLFALRPLLIPHHIHLWPLWPLRHITYLPYGCPPPFHYSDYSITNFEYRIPITQKQSPRNRNNCP